MNRNVFKKFRSYKQSIREFKNFLQIENRNNFRNDKTVYLMKMKQKILILWKIYKKLLSMKKIKRHSIFFMLNH